MKYTLFLFSILTFLLASCNKESIVSEQPLLIGDTDQNSELVIENFSSMNYTTNLNIDIPNDSHDSLTSDFILKFDIVSSNSGYRKNSLSIEIKSLDVQFAIREKRDTLCTYMYMDTLFNGDSVNYHIINECQPIPNQVSYSTEYIDEVYVKGFYANESTIGDGSLEWSDALEYPVYVIQDTWQILPVGEFDTIRIFDYILGHWEKSAKRYIAFKFKKEGVIKYGWIGMITISEAAYELELVYQK